MAEWDHNIQLVCANCSKPFGVLHELAGHTAVCPHCGQQITVTDPRGAARTDSGQDTVRVLKQQLHAHRKCPVCESNVEETDRICINCGYDLVGGQHIRTTFKGPRSRGGLARRLVTAGALAIMAYALYRVILRYL